jgi:O-antigen/teichoic acid export membrane protein
MVKKEMKIINKIFSRNKGFIYVGIGTIGSALIGAFFWFILASIINVQEYGEINYYIALASILSTIALLGLNTTITTYLAKGEEEILYESNSISLISIIFLASIVASFYWQSGFLAIAMTFFAMNIAEILGRRSYSEYAIVCIIERALQLFLSLIGYLLIGLYGIILGYFIAFMIISYRYFLSLRKTTFKINNLREKTSFIIHNYGANLISVLSTYLDKIIIASILGFYILGLYQIAYQFFMFLSVIPGALFQYLLPEESSGKNRKEIEILGIVISIPIVIFIIFLTPYILRNFFPNFIKAENIIQIVCIAVIPSVIASILNAKLLSIEKSKPIFYSGGIYLTTIIIGLIILGKIIGLIGLALSIIIAYTFQAIYLSIEYLRSKYK